MRRRLLFAVLLGFVLALLTAPAAWAHGEHSQSPWLRMNTVAFWNTHFSTDTVQQGDGVTITGTLKILETWPKTLPDPETAYLTVESPGPAFLMKERTINGQTAPHSIYVERGDVYNYSMTIVGRVPGRYHVHPTFAVRSAGTLIGPGQWVTVKKNPNGFTNPVTLYNGKTVNLESYGLGWPVMGYSILTFIIGMVWLLYWIVPKPTVSRLAVTSQISVNDDGGDAVGLVTKRDHRMMNWIMLATILLLAFGFIWQATAFKVKIPQQVDRFRVGSAPVPATFATATLDKATYDPKAETFTMNVTANNTGKGPITLKAVHIANLAWGVTNSPLPADTIGDSGTADLSPAGPIAPGANQALTLTIRGNVMKQNDLLPLGRSAANTNFAAVLRFTDSSTNTDNFVTVHQFVTPIFD
ncbi:MAG TPA: methane monooxygenase/ammonia monooxygenase subunit B [Actinomycetes bacterium]|jgi:methane/ammonia monooxygenase subunit B|nr:methane monooxygenase/ammonia monooxygenase subunit B [Actinomycetes bacterium]